MITKELIINTLVTSALVFTLVFSAVVLIGSHFNLNLSNAHIAWADTEYKSAIVVVNGKEIKLDQNPIVKNGTTLIPIRGVFSELGAELYLNSETQEVTVEHPNTIIMLTIGSKVAYVNGVEMTLTQPAELINGRTLVPLRFVSESIGAKVGWNPDTWTATITFSTSSPSSNSTEGQHPVKTTIDVNALYGEKTYGTKSQSEYDKVMEIVNKTLEKAKEGYWFENAIGNDDTSEYTIRFVAPFINLNMSRRLDIDHENTIGMLLNNGVGLKESFDAYNILYEATITIGMSSEDYNTKLASHSAYDGLVLGIRDCGSYSHAMNAMFDGAGYNTAILANSTHSDPYVKIGDNWFSIMGGVFKLMGSTLSISDELYIYAAPTYK